MPTPSPRKPHAAPVVVLAAALGLGGSVMSGRDLGAADRTAGLVRALDARGLRVDPEGVLWLEAPPRSWLGAFAGTVPVVVRAAPGPDEPNDIYLVAARLSPEGVLLSVSTAYDLTETTAVDEQRPVGHGMRFAFAEQSLLGDNQPTTVRLVDLGGAARPTEARWSPIERIQAALTRWQQTGRLAETAFVTYTIEPAARALRLALDETTLYIDAGDRQARVALDRPAQVPAWLGVEILPERRPGNLVTWAVDRVRAVVGDEAMQYIKAVAFSALDLVLRNAEELTGDTGAEAIAADLGEPSLEPVTRAIPVDPDAGFPPPPLAPWVTPPLAGEGEWHAKPDDPFIHSLPGLPPTFVTTFIRGDRGRKATRVYVVMWDPRLVQLNMMAGVAEPKSATGATGPGLIPREPSVMGRVAAAMNAGFQALHGEFGMMSDGVIYLPPKPYGATVALLRDGSTAFGTWPDAPAIPATMLSYRQNMTVMVQDRQFNPYGRTWWGGTPPGWEDKTHTVRTAICMTEEGFVGYFYGADISPAALARAMIQARCGYGIGLDMNAGHSGLEFYKVGPAAELPPLDRPLDWEWEREGEVSGLDGWRFRGRRLIRGMGLMNFPRYIRREGRDFFYLTVRHVLPGPPAAVPAGASGRPDDGRWHVKGLPQHGFPYALALTELPLPSGRRARLLRVDPRMLTVDPENAVPNEPRTAATAPADAPDGGADGGVGAAGAVGNAKAVVLVLNPVPSVADGDWSVWLTPGAFAVAPRAPLAGAVSIASGPVASQGKVVAAIGAEEDSGMLAYLELAQAETSSAAELQALLRSLGCAASIVLDRPLPLALGGDSDLGAQPTRLPASPGQVVLYRQPGPGARRIFRGTPVVPLKEWYPLQARRIRYFKKKDG